HVDSERLRAGSENRCRGKIGRAGGRVDNPATVDAGAGNAEGAGADFVRRCREVNFNAGVGAGVATATDVDVQQLVVAAGRAIAVSKTDVRSLTVDFTEQRGVFLVQRGAVSFEGRGRGLGGERLQAVEHLGDVAEAAIDDL